MTTKQDWLTELEGYPLVGGQRLLDAGPSERGWHHLATVLTCPQLYAYTYVLQLSRVDSDPLIKGSLIHLGLAHHYGRLLSMQLGVDEELLLGPLEAVRELARQKGARWEVWADFCCAVVERYVQWYRLDEFTIERVEQQFRADIPKTGPWWGDGEATTLRYSQRPDLVLVDRAGRYWIVDHKTRGRADSRTTRAYSRSGQLQGYQLFGRHEWGERFGGVIINYLTIKANKARELDSASFERVIADVYPWRVAAHVDTIQHGEATIKRLLESGVDPWRWPKVGLENGGCEHRYGECPFASLCDYGPGGRPEDRY